MYAERLILETDVSGKLKQMPMLPANKQLKVIFLVIDEAMQTSTRRQPHPDIARKSKIMGNIIDTASTDEWNLSE